ncbi:hypothetical protein SAMN05421740_101738 [Parapedobacter koreensis]|uniref:Uncharacterized protein n=1 Tax=Parapedobacter koreensis TaxID=332977 RepID=A0A1H7GMI3_9SPHI|nr:hypothetical protein SAMN05421740_101738 [Parapedobacter koreensis]
MAKKQFVFNPFIVIFLISTWMLFYFDRNWPYIEHVFPIWVFFT